MDTGFDPAWIDTCEPTQVYKHDARSRVWRIDAPDGRSFVVKRFEYNSLRQLLGYLVWLHPGQRECMQYHWLHRVGVRVAPIVASGVSRRGLGLTYWLVTPYLGASLHNLFFHDELKDEARRQRVLDAAGKLTGELIRYRIFNRDHKASNIVIDRYNRAWLIDFGAVQSRYKFGGVARMLANLSETLTQAGATPSDVARLLKASSTDPAPDLKA